MLRSHADEPHVVLIDHYDLLETPKPDASLTEWQAWTAKNYPAVVSAVTPKLESQGDFIHPLPQAYGCMVAALDAVSGTTDYVPTEFTWVGVPTGADPQGWPEPQGWHSQSNWSDGIPPATHPGATVTIERWPVDGHGAYGGAHGITLAYSPATIGRLRLGGDGGTIVAGTHPTVGMGRLVFDNRGQPGEIEGVGNGTVTIRAAVHSEALLRIDAGTMKSVTLADYAGPGDLVVAGRADDGTNDVHLGLGPASGCRKIAIETGAKATFLGTGIPQSLREIVVNGTLELTATGPSGVVMQQGQLLSGTGTVRVVGPAAARAEITSAGKDLKIIAVAR